MVPESKKMFPSLENTPAAVQTNERDIRFVNGNYEPLYIYNLSEELSILFNYYYKVKSKIVINGKANIVHGIL